MINIALEREEIRYARKIWESSNHEPQDASKCVAIIQNINCIEKFLFIGLANSCKNDYLGAFQGVIDYYNIS